MLAGSKIQKRAEPMEGGILHRVAKSLSAVSAPRGGDGVSVPR